MASIQSGRNTRRKKTLTTPDAFDEFTEKPTNAAMVKLQELVDQRQHVATKLDEFKALVKRGEARLKDLDEREIPEQMDLCGQMECRLVSGLRVKIEEDLYASIPAQGTIESCKDEDEQQRLQERRDRAYEWLEENAPDVIKRSFEIKFGRSEHDLELAAEFERELQERETPLPVLRSETVAPQTLNKLIRDRRAENLALPWELLGIHEKRVAKITNK